MTEFRPPYCPNQIVQVTEAGFAILKLWSSECDEDEWLSVPELELLVELSIAFDFWVKSKYSLGTGEVKFSLGRGK